MRGVRRLTLSLWIAATILLAVAVARRALADTVNPCPGRAVATPTPVDGVTTRDATPDAAAADGVPHAAPPPLPPAPRVRQSADDE